MTVVESPKPGLPTTLEIAARFPHSHRPATAIYFSKTLSRKEPFSPPAPSLFRLILRLEKTLDCLHGRRALVLRPLDYVTKLVSGLLTCKLPLDVNPVAIHATVPAPSLLAQASDVSDSAFA